VCKFELRFNAITSSEVQTILQATEPASFYAQVRTPESGLKTIQCYAGPPEIEAVKGTENWNLSFSLIEY